MGWTSLMNDNNIEVGIVGDAGWDLASDLIKQFHELYLENFGRYATLEEVIQSFEFIYSTSIPDIENNP